VFITKGEFKGKPVIHIKRNEDDRFGISMGLMKAKLVVENIEAIKEFIKENDKPDAGN
jgi:hypothetical protein